MYSPRLYREHKREHKSEHKDQLEDSDFRCRAKLSLILKSENLVEWDLRVTNGVIINHELFNGQFDDLDKDEERKIWFTFAFSSAGGELNLSDKKSDINNIFKYYIKNKFNPEFLSWLKGKNFATCEVHLNLFGLSEHIIKQNITIQDAYKAYKHLMQSMVKDKKIFLEEIERFKAIDSAQPVPRRFCTML